MMITGIREGPREVQCLRHKYGRQSLGLCGSEKVMRESDRQRCEVSKDGHRFR
jgi:hypothetical protein